MSMILRIVVLLTLYASRAQEDAAETIINGHMEHDWKIFIVMNNIVDATICANTIYDAFKLASTPSRIYLNMHDEVHRQKTNRCIQRFCRMYRTECHSLLRLKRISATFRDRSGALGHAARRHAAEARLSTSSQRDSFVLSVDSDIVFTKNWDGILLENWLLTGNDMAILSVAPKAVEVREILHSSSLLHCSAHIVTPYLLAVVEYNTPTIKRNGNLLKFPVLQSQYSEKFFFGPISAILKVPSDPYIGYATTGFEFARASRFWTSGFDFYALTKDVLFARYNMDESIVLSSSSSFAESSYRRIRQLYGEWYGAFSEASRYWLGQKRSVRLWYQFARINPNATYNESTKNQFMCCDEDLKYVHYKL
uniref:Uncharacterized protein AlNc14C149G7465 n=1 Tax=Albugo laibachii Nc14 TaxID=890382 RepID=F0WLV2_9STRA|nr:conserved hypothetical protein [Albugo laibachii Nc14]|eukprot:CCA22278.1 conserved hypothetical protein [Albugo laibachii Nc14]